VVFNPKQEYFGKNLPEKALKTVQGNLIQSSVSPSRQIETEMLLKKQSIASNKGGLEFFMMNNPRLEEMNV
jgi:hypothetical protein